MARRYDVEVDWSVSPRIITVLSPSTSITIQDLHDTLVELEARWDGMDEPRIVSTTGKEFLAPGKNVGLTMTLLNAKLAFEARPGPSFVQVEVDGGNLVALDSDGVTPIEPIQTTAFTQPVRTSDTSAVLLSQDVLQAAVDALGLNVLDLVKAHFNKLVHDPVAGTITIYDDDDVTPLRSGSSFEDAAGTQPYRGQGAERREKMS